MPDPMDDEAAFVAALQRTLGSGRYRVLVAGSDASLRAISRARDLLSGYAILGLPRDEVVERSLDKLALGAASSRHGLGSPPTIVCSGLAEVLAAARQLGFPVVVKPVQSVVESNGSRRHVGSASVGDAVMLRRAVRRFGNRCLVQRTELGRVVSFAGVFADHRLLGAALSRYWRTWHPEAGSAAFSETCEIPAALQDRVIGLLEDLGWEGLFELELIERDQGGWAAIDFNPRPYGSMALAIRAGANLPALWCEYLLGRDPAPTQAHAGMFYRWEEGEIRNVLTALRRRDLHTAAQIARVRDGVVHPLIEVRDPGPYLADAVLRVKALSRRGKSSASAPSPQRAGRERPTGRPQVVVIGAGPYGLAASAFLRSAGLATRCFGEPLEFWRTRMPSGMILRSNRRASNIAAPRQMLTIGQYERSTGRKLRHPSLLLEEFIDYGMWFRNSAGLDVDTRRVAYVARDDGRFHVRLADGEELGAARVVVAAGLAPFGRRPPALEALPRSLVSHSSEPGDFAGFAGKRVIVIGAGQSALESAALLREQGATVEVVARGAAVRWLPDDTQPGLAGRRLQFPLPPTGVGGRLTGWMAAVPDAFRHAPRRLRTWSSIRCIAPAGSGWLRPRLTGVTISCQRFVTSAQARGGRVWLRLDDGSERLVDHVLLGTGFEIDVTQYPFLAPELAAQIEVAGGYPCLGPGLESSVEGLHFLGAPAALSFGPVMRFVVGTSYAAPALTLRAIGRHQPLLRPAF
jgi:hypothetical protein